MENNFTNDSILDNNLDGGQTPILIDASTGTRFWNYVLDIIGFYVCIFILGMILGLTNNNEILELFDNPFFGILLIFLYYLLIEGFTSRSFGKLITKTKVVNTDGEKPSFSQILKRTLCRLIPFEGFSFLGNSNGLHDRLSNTRVVKI